jgi:uncharacterized membrane protein
MNLEKKLREWRMAGVIDQETKDRIFEFETRYKSNGLVYAAGGLGAFTVGVGVISIVAANWEFIPYTIKLAIDLLIVIALAFAIFFAEIRGCNWLKEVFLTIFYIFILASIGLIGQIYQLGIPLYQVFLLWSFSTAPIVMFGQSGFLAVLWLCGLTFTYVLAIEPLYNVLNLLDKNLNSEYVLIYLWPFVLFLMGSRKTLKNTSPAYVQSFLIFGMVGFILLGVLSQFSWGANVVQEDTVSVWGVVLALMVTVGFISALKYLYPYVSDRRIGPFKMILFFNLLTCFTPQIFAHGELPFIGAMSFIILWCLIGWAALQFQMVRLFNFSTAIVGLRIVIVYFEVFGSLLSTGVGMITGGSMTLFLTWLWFKKSPLLQEYLERKSG